MSASPDSPDPLLRIDDLAIDYRTGRQWTPAVRGISIEVRPGELVSLVGESGSGKTTLVQGALGLLPSSARISRGTIAYSGVDVTGWPDKRMKLVRGNHVGFIPQDPNTSLNPVKRIGHQVIEAVRFNAQDGRRDAAAHREQALESLQAAGLADAERVFDQYPHELSGGMKQRALIAIALAGKPSIIVADEPTSALDVTVQKRILDHLAGLREELDLGVLLVTHDLGVALDRSDRIAVMQEGRLVEEGDVAQVLTSATDPYTRRLLEAAPSRHEGRLRPGTAVEQKGSGSSSAAEPAVVADALTKTYRLRGRGAQRDLRALDDAKLAVRRGTTHAIVGESGAGKSTLAGILVGFTNPESGTVHIDGTEVTALGRREWRGVRRDLQFVFQNPFTSLDPRFTVSRLIAEPLRAFGLARTKAQRAERVSELLTAVALDDSYAHRLPGQLSGGQRQRVAIARALALEPKVIVLDEAVSALDVSVQAQILQLLIDLQAELGLTYVFVTHDLGVVRLVADDVTVMRAGVVVESGPVGEIFANPSDDYTRALIEAIPGRRHAVAP